jgi:hypothetical protein
VTVQKWGGLASFPLAAAFIVAPLIYLTGDLRSATGPITYHLADFLYGPVWAASLVTATFALRERVGERAPRRMSLALLAALLAAGAMVLVACIRSANRSYHILHPELHLEMSTPVLVVWTTIVAGVTGAGWHFLGWALVLTGSAGWASGRIQRPLCALYLVGGIAALFVYVFPTLEGAAALLGVGWAVWQGILLWKGERSQSSTPSDTPSVTA